MWLDRDDLNQAIALATLKAKREGVDPSPLIQQTKCNHYFRIKKNREHSRPDIYPEQYQPIYDYQKPQKSTLTNNELRIFFRNILIHASLLSGLKISEIQRGLRISKTLVKMVLKDRILESEPSWLSKTKIIQGTPRQRMIAIGHVIGLSERQLSSVFKMFRSSIHRTLKIGEINNGKAS